MTPPPEANDPPSDPDTWGRIRSAFGAALEVDADAREAWIDEQHHQDPKLWDEVRSLLARHETVADADRAASHATEHPESIGGYRILGLLGQGGMGVVYRAEQDNPTRDVALKVVRPEHAAGSALKRFAFEAEVLGRLTHPNIAQIFDAGTVEVRGLPTPYLSMELIDGQPLHHWARDRSDREVIELMAQVCDAVDSAHCSNVIHRDLKPGNILVTRDGRPKVLDFGLAAATDSDLLVTTMHTRTGELLGTVPYMSPEQVSGDPSSIDTRTDIYALGVILHTLLVGKLPYDVPQHSLLDALRSIREAEPVRLGSVRRDLRGDVETIVLKALEKDKARRYPTAAALAEDLRAHLEARPIGARPASTLYQIRKFTSRNRALVAGTSATIVALLAGLIVSINYGQGEARQREAAERAIQDVQAVSRLQGDLFRYVDGRSMGIDLLAELRTSIGAARLAAGRKPNVVEQELAVFDELVADVNPAGVVQGLIADGVIALASRRFDEQMGGRPLVAAELHAALSQAFFDLGQSEQALAELRQALVLLPEDAPPIVRMRIETTLQWILGSIGQYEESDELYERLSVEWARSDPEHRLAWTMAAGHLLINVKRGLMESGIALADEWMARLPEPEHFQDHHGMLLAHAAQAYVAAGQVDDAERAILLRADMDPDISPLADRQLEALGTLAVLREQQGRLEEAEELYRREIAGHEARSGRLHENVAVPLNNLAYCLLQQEEFVESAACMVEAIDIARATLGPDHPDTALFVHTLGEVHLAAGDFDAAVERLDEAVGLYRNARNSHHVALALAQAASALAALGDLDAAFARLEDARGEPGFGPHLLEAEEFAALRADLRFAAYGG